MQQIENIFNNTRIKACILIECAYNYLHGASNELSPQPRPQWPPYQEFKMLTFQEFKSAVNQYGLPSALSIASHLITLDQALIYTSFIKKGV